MATGSYTSEDIELVEVVITADRFPPGSRTPNEEFNITNLVAEITIFESIYNPYLTGIITFMDDYSLYTYLDIQGTERVRISLKNPELSSAGRVPLITKNFIVLNIEQTEKFSDNVSVHSLKLIEDIGYYGEVQQYSKSYVGNGETIITNIINDKLSTNVITKSDNPSVQAPFRYIVPNITPFAACKKILDKITTETGFPFYLYSTLTNDGLYLKDLQTILETEPFNMSGPVSAPFILSQATTNYSTTDPTKELVRMNKTQLAVREDTLLLAQNGAIGSNFAVTELTTGATTARHVNTAEDIFSLYKTNILKKNFAMSRDVVNLYDNRFVPDPSKQSDLKLGDYDSKFIHHIAGDTYRDYLNYTQDDSPEKPFLRQRAVAIKEYMMKNSFVISVPGALFMMKGDHLSVGSAIALAIFKNIDPALTTDIIDPKLSGSFVMMMKKHIITRVSGGKTSHNVEMQVGRVINPKEIVNV